VRHISFGPRRLLCAVLLTALVFCCHNGRAPACTDCVEEALALSAGDATTLRARVFTPRGHADASDAQRDRAGAARGLPAVVVIPGYLANTGFLEIPWAADLTRAGMVALLIDRRGHGGSSGTWWPAAHDTETRLEALAPDIRAALAYLRGRAPLVDPERIALLGHSDGATGALMAASGDWDVAATVSISASVAPWEYVNHAAPRNLLLLYGGADRFILADTDRFLIDSATRGYLHGDGEVGSRADGTARRLERVPGYGHLEILYSDVARRAALAWLAGALGATGEVALSPLRWGWVVAGLLLLLCLIYAWNVSAPPLAARVSVPIHIGKLLLLAGLWTLGIAFAAWLGPQLYRMPVQEGGVVTAVLAGTAVSMGAVAIPLFLRRRRPSPGARRRWTIELLGGAAAGLAVQLAAELILRPMYAFPFTEQRLALFGLFILISAPAFAALCTAATWLPAGQVAPAMPIEVVLAGITAAVATVWFVRMSALPLVLLACALLFVGAYRSGGRAPIGAAAFGAVLYARAAADVCAFY
jgi:dienelactone hydrolase